MSSGTSAAADGEGAVWTQSGHVPYRKRHAHLPKVTEVFMYILRQLYFIYLQTVTSIWVSAPSALDVEF